MAEHKTFSILNISGLFLAGSIVACGPIPVRPAPVPTALPLAPAVSSCDVNPKKQQAIDVRDVAWSGQAGDRSWVLAKSGQHRVLLRLIQGHVEPLILPEAFDTGFVSAYAREHFIWVLRTGTDKPISGAAWVLVDVSDPVKPKVGRIELLDPLPAEEPNRFALWNDRAMFFIGSPGELVLWNLADRSSITGRIKPEAKATDTPWLHCSASSCLAITPEGQEDKRRMVLRRVDRKGGETSVDIGPGVVAESTNFLWGDRILTAWSRFDAKGLWARQVDSKTGEFLGAAYTVAGVESDIQDPQAIRSRKGVLLAWQAARLGWRLGKLDEDGVSVSDVVTLPAAGSFLSAATTDDGIVVSIYSAGQDEERGGNEWYSSVRALFVPFGKAPAESDVVTLVNDEHGRGHGGFGGYALGAPDAGAVLVVPEGNAQGESFVMALRKECSEK
jgi:hypothetical protein